MNLIKDAVSNGANIETGGNIPKKFTKGCWLEPTVLSNVNSKKGTFTLVLRAGNDNVKRKQILETNGHLSGFEVERSVVGASV